MCMRTTLILEDETMIQLKEMAVRDSRTLTEVVAETLARGLGRRDVRSAQPWTCLSYDMGGGFDYVRAWDRINELEAAAVAEKMDLRK